METERKSMPTIYKSLQGFDLDYVDYFPVWSQSHFIRIPGVRIPRRYVLFRQRVGGLGWHVIRTCCKQVIERKHQPVSELIGIFKTRHKNRFLLVHTVCG